MTRSSKTWLGVAVAGVLALSLYLFVNDSPAPEMSWETPQPRFEPQLVQSNENAGTTATGAPVSSAAPKPDEAVGQEVDDNKTFRVDASGNLVLDEQTRLKIEELLALTEPSKVQGAILEKTQDLPPAAARRAEELVARYRDYAEAQRATYPPGDSAPLTEDDAIQQLDGLHALRVQHFGPEVAAAFYANEEKLSRELVELMRLEKDKSMTMEEKAARAQALHDQLPTVAAIERNNRAPLPHNDKPANPPETTNR